MENTDKSQMTRDGQDLKNSCNVNSTFNFTVGAVSIAVAGLIGYLLYHFL